MDTALVILQTSWFFVIGFFFIGYTLLDGFDLGIGALFPLLARDNGERKKLFSLIGPVWDGNEVWLVAGGASLFAAFPVAYACVFSGFYLAFMLLLVALIFRAVSIEFWEYDEPRRPFWAAAFTVSSALAPVLFGVALGNIILGIPLDASMNYAGSFGMLFRPFPLAIGLIALAVILLQGSAYALKRSDGDMAVRARAVMNGVWIAVVITFPVAAIAALYYLPNAWTNIPAWLGAVSVIAALVGMRFVAGQKVPFYLSSAVIISLWIIAASVHFPNLVQSSTTPITIYNASSGKLTLTVMSVIAAVGIPLVLVYTVVVYRIFKHKRP
ncbi:MAG: cytochrome d ubiquinol oxidase subunit II [Spirochaetes bacterium]|nr:cytochrome d ubiquinol oxidase subunit II [Spirochaetota bacterium]